MRWATLLYFVAPLPSRQRKKAGSPHKDDSPGTKVSTNNAAALAAFQPSRRVLAGDRDHAGDAKRRKGPGTGVAGAAVQDTNVEAKRNIGI